MFTIEGVRAEIENAFGSLPVPHTNDLLGPTTSDEKGESAIQRALAGKHWSELDTDFLRQSWSSFCYLSAEGYRFYLPALLMRSLDDFQLRNPSPEEQAQRKAMMDEALHKLFGSSSEQETYEQEIDQIFSESMVLGDLLCSTLFHLRPRYWPLYTEGRDEHFEYQTTLFTPDQYGAVCSFLGFAFEQHGRGADALYWHWNREPHPALTLAQNFYDEMRHFEWPESQNPAVRHLIAQIREAFSETPYPTVLDGNQVNFRAGDDEITEILLEFRGQNWRTLHPQFLGGHETALSFLPHAGFRYFLPTFLIADVMGEEIESLCNADPVFQLTHGIADERRVPDEESEENREPTESYEQNGWYQYALERFADFTLQERQAVAAYLRFQIERINDWNNDLEICPPGGYSEASLDFHRVPIQQALERFWAR